MSRGPREDGNVSRRSFHDWLPDEGGCPVHGDAECRPCELCGTEFCAACFPDSSICPSCAAEGGLDQDDELFADEDLWDEEDLFAEGDKDAFRGDAGKDFGDDDR